MIKLLVFVAVASLCCLVHAAHAEGTCKYDLVTYETTGSLTIIPSVIEGRETANTFKADRNGRAKVQFTLSDEGAAKVMKLRVKFNNMRVGKAIFRRRGYPIKEKLYEKEMEKELDVETFEFGDEYREKLVIFGKCKKDVKTCSFEIKEMVLCPECTPETRLQKHNFTVNVLEGGVKDGKRYRVDNNFDKNNSHYGRVRVAFALHDNSSFRLTDLKLKYQNARKVKALIVYRNNFKNKSMEKVNITTNTDDVMNFAGLDFKKNVTRAVVEARCFKDDNDDCNFKVIDLKACPVKTMKKNQ